MWDELQIMCSDVFEIAEALINSEVTLEQLKSVDAFHSRADMTEEAVWNYCKTHGLYQRYLQLYPNGRFVTPTWPFASFSIRKNADNTIVNIDEVDRMVCDEFNLAFTDKDYGHFYFTESEKELGTFQKSISWAGLIHTIVYYSNINYGKSTTYDIEAAMAWIREHAIHFPHSATVFTSRLVKLLKQKGLYVYVNFRRDEDYNEHEYENAYNRHKILRNESGVFECDNKGKLLRFYPDPNNLLDKTRERETYTFGKSYYKPCIHSLIIPEGVTAISESFFRYGFVEDTIQFPDTLCSIGDRMDRDVFADTHLPDIVIPETVGIIGNFAFGNSVIKSVRFSHVIGCEYLRQFKGAYIETLYLPNECRQQWEKCFDGYAYLHEAKNVEFY